jgi:hypothetical protein
MIVAGEQLRGHRHIANVHQQTARDVAAQAQSAWISSWGVVKTDRRSRVRRVAVDQCAARGSQGRSPLRFPGSSKNEGAPMADLTLAYEARSYSSGTPGRAICNARNHHIVADGPGGEALGAGELFLSGIAACAVNMVHRVAQSDAIPMNWLDVRVASYQDPDKEPEQLTVWDACRSIRDMGCRRRPRDLSRGRLEEALTALRIGRRGDPQHQRHRRLSRRSAHVVAAHTQPSPGARSRNAAQLRPECGGICGSMPDDRRPRTRAGS